MWDFVTYNALLYKIVFFVKNQQQVGHNREVEQHLLDISNFFNKSKTEKLGVFKGAEYFRKALYIDCNCSRMSERSSAKD